MQAQCLAEEAGFIYVTDAALEKRSAGRVDGEMFAHYQLLKSNDRGTDVYWVERLGRRDSWHFVEIMEHAELTWATCDCEWFIHYRIAGTVCVHILSAVQMHRARNKQ